MTLKSFLMTTVATFTGNFRPIYFRYLYFYFNTFLMSASCECSITSHSDVKRRSVKPSSDKQWDNVMNVLIFKYDLSFPVLEHDFLSLPESSEVLSDLTDKENPQFSYFIVDFIHMVVFACRPRTIRSSGVGQIFLGRGQIFFKRKKT